MAILAVAGITVFTNTQKNARDAKRRQDVEAISKALETRYDAVKNEYAVVDATWFNSGIPLDPKSSANYIGVPNALGATYEICADLESVGTWDGTNKDFCRKQQQ